MMSDYIKLRITVHEKILQSEKTGCKLEGDNRSNVTEKGAVSRKYGILTERKIETSQWKSNGQNTSTGTS